MDPIAVVGFSFKFPEAGDSESAFWEVLENGRNVMTEWPKSRSNVDSFYSQGTPKENLLTARGAHFLSQDPATFDAPFFSITSKEAASMDPQQRWLLETAYRALENAGIPVEKVAGTQTSVFAASMTDDYTRIIAKDPDEAPTNTATGNNPSILANRLSWYYDLRGPSVSLNTACSTSMIAMDLACQSLRSGQCSMAMVTGSTAILSIETSLYLSSMNFLSPDSLCYSFDHRANGYARGEGVAVLILKKLTDAIRGMDTIRAIIRATGSNQDGHTPGLTQPSPSMQEDLIRQVYKSAGLGFESTRYVEAHGTGTQLGDAAEANALGRVFRTSRSSREPLYLGSVKANIGHLEGASALAGILKCIQVLERGIIPPNALFERMNPRINAKFYNLQVPTQCIPWPSPGLRRVSINSFGFGGSNGHIIMDDAYHSLEALALKGLHQTMLPPINHQTTSSGTTTNERETKRYYHVIGRNGLSKKGPINRASTNSDTESADRISNRALDATPAVNGATANGDHLVSELASTPQILTFSTRDKGSLQRMLEQYATYFRTHVSRSQSRIERLAYILATRRSLMTWRSFAIASSSEMETLEFSPPVRSTREVGAAFIFTGQGAQYAEMGRDLLRYRIFRSVLEEAAEILRRLGAGWNLFEELKNAERIDKPDFSQPLCTVLQIALVELLKSWNITPAAVVGHSSGEIAAAYAIGALSLESACRVAYHRGRLSGQLAASSKGAMMSVNLSEDTIASYLVKIPLKENVTIACVNSPFNVTLSAIESDIDILKTYLDKDKIFAAKLRTGVAYHSPDMQSVSAEYYSCLEGLSQGTPRINSVVMISSVTGTPISPLLASEAQYWVDNLVSVVRFADALAYLILVAPKEDHRFTIHDMLEIGPHGALRRPVTDTLSYLGNKNCRYTSALSKFDLSLRTTLDMAGKLFAIGYPISVASMNQQNLPPQMEALTDMPAYPFDSKQWYWHESRLSKDWRLRGAAPNEVLGARATDWNPLEPRWRKRLCIEDMPWVADHVVGNTIVYPGTGMLIMAVEAARHLATTGPVISRFHIRDVTFISPIVVQPRVEGRTEVITQLRSLQQAHEKTSNRSEVRIFSIQDGTWSECFTGIVQIEYAEPPPEGFSSVSNHLPDADVHLPNWEYAQNACDKLVAKTSFYKWHHNNGIHYGEAFQLTEDIHWDGGNLAISRVGLEPQHDIEALAHPAVLDALCQTCFVPPSKGASASLATVIPYKIQDVWFAASGWKCHDTSHIRMIGISKIKTGVTGLDCDLTALGENGLVLAQFKKLEMLPILNDKTQDNQERRLLHSLEWNPQLSLLTREQLYTYCSTTHSTEDQTEQTRYPKQLDEFVRSMARTYIAQLQETEWSSLSPQNQRLGAWIKERLKDTTSEAAEPFMPGELENLLKMRPIGAVFISLSKNLHSALRSEIDFRELFSPTDIEGAYATLSVHEFNEGFSSYLNLLSHQTPLLNILEVGANTGAMTKRILTILRHREERSGGIAFKEYVFTDPSADVLHNSKSKFEEEEEEEEGERMRFQTLDFDSDATKQGLESASFDVIFASVPISSSFNISFTLRNLNSLLKPGGKLVLHEPVRPDLFFLDLGLNLLGGSFHKKKELQTIRRIFTENQWDELLKDNGFTGNEMVLRDYENDAAHTFSTIVSTARPRSEEVLGSSASQVLFVVEEGNEYQKLIVTALTNDISTLSSYETRVVAVTALENTKEMQADYVIFLAEIRSTILSSMTVNTFNAVKKALQRWRNLLWVTSDARPSDPPYAGLQLGFLRTICSESNNKHILSLSLQDRNQHSSSAASQIIQVFKAAFEQRSPELEYVVRNNHILTPRIVEETKLSKSLNASLHAELSTSAWLPGPPLKLNISSRGSLETLHFTEDTEYYTQIQANEVQIEAKAWGLSFRDIFIALGRLEEDDFGIDCAGVVTRCGDKSKFKPGDRVCMAALGCMKTYPRTNQWVVKIPDLISYEEAAAVVNPGLTAYHSLIEVARLQKGEKILIHAAAGGTGQLAILVAQMVGAEVFCTVGFEHKKKLLVELFGIPEDHIFYSRNTNFKNSILSATDGYGVDVVLNSLVGEGLRASWECVAPYGRFIELGKMDIKNNSQLPMKYFANNVSFLAVDVRHISLTRPELGQEVLENLIALTAKRKLFWPRPLHVYGLEKLEEAFRYLQSGKSSGRIVINIDPKAPVPKCLFQRCTWKFDENATYVIAGGLGGIGRSIMKWMASRGAKNLIVPSRWSRSATASRAAIETVEQLMKQGVRVATPRCDVSSESSLKSVLDECAKTMPPIRGCINAAMVLQDAIFDNMTHTQWTQTINSKVATSWNLHKCLPDNMDFFILLASIAGIIGSAGQANYASGCTFQDALARQRVLNGKKALSIDLGVMRTIGIVAETGKLQKTFEDAKGMTKIEENELLALLDIYCDPECPIAEPDKSQIVIGLVTPADMILQGDDPIDMLQRPLFANFAQPRHGSKHIPVSNATNYGLFFKQAKTHEQKVSIVIEALAQKLARALSIQPEEIDPNKTLHVFGVDSLVAIELRNWIGKEFAAEVAVFDIMSSLSVGAIGALVTKLSKISKDTTSSM